MHPLTPILASTVLATAGCCLPVAQTETDPERAWALAFAVSPPEGVVVRRGTYWRSGHWSDEFAYFFELDASEAQARALAARVGATEVGEADAAERVHMELPVSPPPWFAPLDRSYVVLRGDPLSLLISPDTGQCFIGSASI